MKLGVVAYTFNCIVKEAEVGRSLLVLGQPGLHSKTLSKQSKAKQKQNKKQTRVVELRWDLHVSRKRMGS